jgi:Nucleotidyltransferase domain
VLHPVAEHIAGLLKRTLAGWEPVRAVFLNGSHVAGTATETSDIDCTVLVADEPTISGVLARLGGVFAFLGERHEVPHFGFGGAVVAACVYPQAWADDWVAHAFDSPESLRQWQGWLQHKIVDALPIHDPHGLLAQYQARVAHYPETLGDRIAEEALDDLRAEYLAGDLFRNEFHFAYCLQDILEHVGLALYARNRRFFAAPLKTWHRDLTGLRPDLRDELSALISLSPATDLADKRAILAAVVERLTPPPTEAPGAG